MKRDQANGFVSPMTGAPLRLDAVIEQEGERVREGTLLDATGRHRVRIRGYIPRFVDDDGYAENFAEQWNRFRQVQIDGENDFTLSSDRFYRWTKWRKEELKGARVLEIGCGAGRFTQVLLEAGARVHAFDLTGAVDACWQTCGPHENLCLFQGDCYQIPLASASFDFVFFYGVIQHTPDPEKALQAAVRFLRPGGKLSIDCYTRPPFFSRWHSKYLWRPITTRLPTKTLLKIVEWYVPKWLPVDTRLARVPRIGHALVSFIPCWNYGDWLHLDPEQIKAWAVLDTFDALGAKYDFPQTLETVRRWFETAGLADIEVVPGSNGIVGNATQPGAKAQSSKLKAQENG